jgi:hypothetical protein
MGETLKDARALVIGAADVGLVPTDVPTRNGG